MPVLLHSIALLVSLFVQSTSSVCAGAWLMFHLMGTTILLYKNKYAAYKTGLWLVSLSWLIAIVFSAFVLAPVFNGAYWMWVLSAMPMLMLALQEKDLQGYIRGFAGVLIFFALLLAIQKIFDFHLGIINYPGRMAWPLLDPNNAAAMLNLAFTPFLWLTLFKDRRWGFITVLFAYALYATGSMTGIAAAGMSALILYIYKDGWGILFFVIALTIVFMASVFIYRPELIADGYSAFATRFPIWWAAWQILLIHPLRGIGLGAFGHYYLEQGGTGYVPPSFVHNDLLQFAVEMGLPVAIIFAILMAVVAVQTNKNNLVTACTALTIFIQSMMEFQFYLPSVTLGMGLVLAYHDLHSRRSVF